MKIGCIGLGKMGGGLARNLILIGHDVTVYDLSEAAIQQTLAIGGKSAKSAVELAPLVDVLFTSLPLPVHLVDLLTGESGILQHMNEGSTIIDISTIDPSTARKMFDAAADRRVQFLACPLGKGPAQAAEGTEPIFAGGEKEVFEQFEGLLNQIGSPVCYLGNVEQSTAFKLISNLIGMTNLLVMSEGLRLGEKAGIEPRLLHELLFNTGADSYQLKVRGPMILTNDYSPKFSVNLALKDVRLGVNMADLLDQTTPCSKLALEYFQKTKDRGYGEEDCSAIYKVLDE